MSDGNRPLPLRGPSQRQGKDSPGQIQQTDSPRQSERSTSNGLPSLRAAAPPPKFSNHSAVNSPASHNHHLAQPPEGAGRAQPTRQISLGGQVIPLPEPSQHVLSDIPPALQRGNVITTPGFSAPFPLFSPWQMQSQPSNAAAAAVTRQPSTGAATAMNGEATPSPSSRERTPATPRAQQPSRIEARTSATPPTPSAGLASSQDGPQPEAWQTPPRRPRTGGRTDQKLWHLAAIAEAAFRAPSDVEDTFGTLTPSTNDASIARTDQRLAVADLPDRNRSVTSREPRSAARNTSLPRERSTGSARPSPSQASGELPLSQRKGAGSASKHTGEVRVQALRMLKRGLSFGEVGERLNVQASEIEYWAGDKRRGPRGPQQTATHWKRRQSSAAESGEIPTSSPESSQRAVQGSAAKSRSAASGPSSRLSPISRESPGAARTVRREPSRAAGASPSNNSREGRSPERSGTTVTDEGRAAWGAMSATTADWAELLETDPRLDNLQEAETRRAESLSTGEVQAARGSQSLEAPRSVAAALLARAKPNSSPKARKPAKANAGRASASRAEESDSELDAELDANKARIPGKRRRKEENKRIKFSAEIRGEALRLHAENPSAKTIAAELERFGVQAHNISNWVLLQKKGRMNNRGQRFYPRGGQQPDSPPKLYPAYAAPRSQARAETDKTLARNDEERKRQRPVLSSANVRGRAIQLWLDGLPSYKILRELGVEGIGSDDVFHWAGLHSIGVLDDQGNELSLGSRLAAARAGSLEDGESDPGGISP